MPADFETRIAALIADLTAAPVPPDAFNPYSAAAAGDTARNNATRRENLRLYLLEMAHRFAAGAPRVLLLAEAPGYRGCRLTGVPVTSRLLLVGIPELGLFGAAQGYQQTDDAGFEDVRGEQTATILWGTLAGLGVAPLIWNTYPFHPHKPGEPRSNRAPRSSEIAQGMDFARLLLALYEPAQIIAVGNTAAHALAALQLPHDKVRHPAQGGKRDFVTGLGRLLG